MEYTRFNFLVVKGDCKCKCLFNFGLCNLVVDHILEEVLSGLNRHGTQKAFSVHEPTLTQLAENYYTSGGLAQNIKRYGLRMIEETFVTYTTPNVNAITLKPQPLPLATIGFHTLDKRLMIPKSLFVTMVEQIFSDLNRHGASKTFLGSNPGTRLVENYFLTGGFERLINQACFRGELWVEQN